MMQESEASKIETWLVELQRKIEVEEVEEVFDPASPSFAFFALNNCRTGTLGSIPFCSIPSAPSLLA